MTATVLLVDAENVSATRVDQVFEIVGRIGEAMIRRAYGDWGSTHLKPWSSVCVARGINQRQHSPSAVGKNGSDIALAVDAVDLWHERHPHTVILVSGDSDFTSLATFLREKGTEVHVIGGHQAPEAFRAVCTEYHELPRAATGPRAEAPRLAQSAASPSRATASTPAVGKTMQRGAKKMVAKQPDVRQAVAKKAVATRAPGQRTLQRITPKVEDRLRSAIKATADADGWSAISSMAKELSPGIRPKNFGHASWTKLLTGRQGFELRDANQSTAAVRSTG